ncbi:MAG: hypothetical protein Q4F65_12225 [Propionibacteriaceae bacterium]|nr:hypothetical protein [Propionibacteriaceae bacterium]
MTWRDSIQWTEDELDLLRVTRHMSASQVAELMPGRTAGGVKKARQQLQKREPWLNFGDYAIRNKDPHRIGRRPLVAKTCTKCGELRDGTAYYFDAKDRVWFSCCRYCHAADRKRLTSGKVTQGQRVAYQRKQRELNEMTLKNATRHGQEWTEKDAQVLSDPDLMDVEKALLLRRTYYATVTRRRDSGLVSKRINHIGDPDACRWFIDAPNAVALMQEEGAA